MNTIPAPPGTYLLERQQGAKEARKIPVIGFAFVQIGPAYPICAISHGGLTRGRVLVTADGFVTDPSYGVVCGNVEEWMALSAKAAYWTAKEQMPSQSAGKAPSSDEEPSPVSGASQTANARPAPAGGSGRAISFGTKTFKTLSFWKAALDGETVGIFKIEGEQFYPKDPACEKITRDEFTALKKNGVPVYDDPINARLGGAPAADEDDGMDLV